MSPRPYRLGQRLAATDQTRTRIIAAARDILVGDGGATGFAIDAIARAADVARVTVYYQFGSKAGLLEAVFDDLAARGGLEQLPAAFQRADPLDALDELVGAFCRFWDSDRLTIRRLQALAALDPELDRSLRTRAERRRHGLGAVIRRIAAQHGRPAPESLEETVDTLFALTSFETFDTLAANKRGLDDTTRILRRLAHAVLDPGGRWLANGTQEPGEVTEI